MQATARIFFDRCPARRNKNGQVPVRLCITHKNVRKYYSITERLKKNEWKSLPVGDIAKVTGDSPRGKYRDIAFEYKHIIHEVEKIIESIPNFSFNQFEDKYFNKIGLWDNVFIAMWSHIQDLKTEGRYGYASSFECGLRSIKEFHTGKKFEFNPRRDKVKMREQAYIQGKELRFVDITPQWLKRYEKWMTDQGLGRSTQGIYVRNLRVLFNIAIKRHHVNTPYPFHEHKPKKALGRKSALTAHQISMIANYDTDHPLEQFYRDIFMFSFMANGMNCNDIARLKYSNINKEELSFVRQKTKNKEEEVNINLPIAAQMRTIIDRHGTRAVGFDAYIFPVLKSEMTDEMKYAKIKYFIKSMNSYIKRIAKSLGIEENVSSYSARHSWATISKNSGVSTEFIKEALGHSSVNVTELYLKQFEKETRREHAEKMEQVVFNKNAI